MCSLCNPHYCWGLAHLLKMYALELNISKEPCSWVSVIEIQSLEILFRSHRKNIIHTVYVHTFYYINSWACIVKCRSSGMLCSFNCATVRGVAEDWHAFFMCRVKEENKSQLNFMVTTCIKNIHHFIVQLMHTTLKNVELLKHFKIRKLLQHVSVYKETIIREPQSVLS